jgi:hypothetical protein
MLPFLISNNLAPSANYVIRYLSFVLLVGRFPRQQPNVTRIPIRIPLHVTPATLRSMQRLARYIIPVIARSLGTCAAPAPWRRLHGAAGLPHRATTARPSSTTCQASFRYFLRGKLPNIRFEPF